ncbi:MAG TPA: lytic transglycosylase domain-containing protein, partial [Methylibium sp.]
MFLFAAAASLGTALLLSGVPACAQSGGATKVGDTIVLDARDALRRQDKARLAAARTAIAATQHPLAMWVDYWELNNRLSEASQDELDAFYARWPGTYVEDRLRNDWLLELGKRRDWRNLAREYPRFRMNDDREVSCYALLARHFDGEDVRTQARAAWLAQREADDGCALLASTLYAAGRFTPADVWRKARLATEANRQKVATQAAGLIGDDAAKALAKIFDDPLRYLARTRPRERNGYELAALAVLRLAGNDPQAAATQLDEPWGARLRRELGPPDLAWIWASVGKQAALKLAPEADAYYQRAAQVRPGAVVDLPDDTLAWQARTALRADNAADHWPRVLQAIAALSPAEQREPTWVYWKARALQAMDPPPAASTAASAAPVAASGAAAPAASIAAAAAASGASDAQPSAPKPTPAQLLLESIANQYSFYGKLAAEELGRPFAAPPKPAPLTPQELTQARATPGLARSLQLIALGLRNEGVREWNYTLRGMGDRELLAAAQIACEAQVWDRCINTSDRTRSEIDMAQRFPTPYREDVVRAASESGIDPAYLYGLIRQES